MAEQTIRRTFRGRAPTALEWSAIEAIFDSIWGETSRSLPSFPAIVGGVYARWRDGAGSEFRAEHLNELAEAYKNFETALIIISSQPDNFPDAALVYHPARAVVEFSIRGADAALVDRAVQSVADAFPLPAKRPPRVFIGSSVEALDLAYAIQANLEYDAECTVWTQGVFGLSTFPLEALEEAKANHDYAVLVLTPDDLTTKRGVTGATPRDNVLFELGVFVGAYGRRRTLIVRPREVELQLPSDLDGVGAATFRWPLRDNYRAALGTACSDIRDAIRREDAR